MVEEVDGKAKARRAEEKQWERRGGRERLGWGGTTTSWHNNLCDRRHQAKTKIEDTGFPKNRCFFRDENNII